MAAERDRQSVTVTINGDEVEREVPPRRLLSDFIRHDVGLTGTHVGCEHGVCGMCTILMDGETVRSCLTFAVQADGAEIQTVESLGTAEDLHPLQQAFTEKHGLQCGFCTPAMLLTSMDFLEENPEPDREEIRDAVSNNLCRCTGYQQIVDSVEYASELMAGEESAAETGGQAAEAGGDD